MKKRVIYVFSLFLIFGGAIPVLANPEIKGGFETQEVSLKQPLFYNLEVTWQKEGQTLQLTGPQPVFFGLTLLNRSEENESFKKDNILWQRQSYRFTLQLIESESKAGVKPYEIEVKEGENSKLLKVEGQELSVLKKKSYTVYFAIGLFFLMALSLVLVLGFKRKNKKFEIASQKSFEEECSEKINVLTFEEGDSYTGELKELQDTLAAFTSQRFQMDLKKLKSEATQEVNKISESDRKKIEDFVSELTELRYADRGNKAYDAKRLATRISSYIESKKIIPIKDFK